MLKVESMAAFNQFEDILTWQKARIRCQTINIKF